MSTAFFKNDRTALFQSRPNRFLIMARDSEHGEELRCHCPNPGRIAEFALPDTELILEHRESPGTTEWTAVAARYKGEIVPLHSARANHITQALVLPKLFPEARSIRAEFRIRTSRFDFFIENHDGSRHLLEVKSCSLVEWGVAMFPDAPSTRALKHLTELADLAREGWICHVLFFITHGHPATFIPALHTDPEFAAALGTLAPELKLHALSLEVREDGQAGIESGTVPIDLTHTALAGADRGSYLILLKLAEATTRDIGKLGTMDFSPGWYVYSGSARRNLAKRTARHCRRSGKATHWHLDYLTPAATLIKALPVASYDNLECELASRMRILGGVPVPRFGSSDCTCESHLHYFTRDPMQDRSFLDSLFYFRHRRSLEVRHV